MAKLISLWTIFTLFQACASTNLGGIGADAPLRREGAVYLRSCIYERGRACCLYSNAQTGREEAWCKPTVYGEWVLEGVNEWNESR
jgi:hypothetical protein